MNKIILASASPRRKELLALLGYSFLVEAADVNEDILNGELAIDYVFRISKDKCQKISNKYEGNIVLSADTSVVIGNAVLGKPINHDDSVRMLKLLSGVRHQVITAFSIYDPRSKKISTNAVESFVTFRVINKDEINEYAMSKEGLDKAGGYGLQNSAIKFISSIEGSPSNIIGLPLVEIKSMLDGLECPY